MPHRSIEERLADLERESDDEKEERKKLQSDVKPIVALYNAGVVIGKLLWIIGGLIVGTATVWAAISGWLSGHWKS